MTGEKDYVTSGSRLYTVHGEKKQQGQLMWIQGRLALGYVKNGEYIPKGYTYIDEMVTRGMAEDIPRFDDPSELDL